MQVVINTFGTSIRKQGEVFRIVREGKHIDVAARKVRSIVVATGAHLSTDALKLASDHNIDVVLLDKYGQPYGRFWLAKMGSTAAIRRAQLEVAESAEGLEMVRSWTCTKLRNQAEFLAELGRRRPAKSEEFEVAAARIVKQEEALEALAGTVEERREQVLGAEGAGGAAYWSLIGTLPPKNFAFASRSKHPARDPFNAMLNYAYGILYSQVERACILAGLDPFVGFLRAPPVSNGGAGCMHRRTRRLRRTPGVPV